MGQRIKQIYNTLSTGIYTLKKKLSKLWFTVKYLKKLDMLKNYS